MFYLIFCLLLLNFYFYYALYRNPTPDEEMKVLTAMGIPQWTPYKFEDHHYLLIQDEFTMQKEYMDR